MKYLKLIFLAIIVFQFKIETNAQINIRERQKIYKGALDILDKYQVSLSGFKKDLDYENFESLFTTEKVKVFNDIMPENKLNEKVESIKYLKGYNTWYVNKQLLEVYIEPYEMGPVILDDNKTGYINVGAYKICSGETDKGVNYIDTFDIIVKVEFNLTTSPTDFKIAGINANKSYGHYSVLKLDFNDISSGNNSIIIKRDEAGNSVSDTVVCSKKYYVLKDIKKSTNIKVSAENNTLIPTYGVTYHDFEKEITFRKPKWYVEFDFGINPLNSTPVVFSGDSMNINSVNELSYNVGFNIGYSILPNQNIYIKTGLLFNQLNYSTKLDQHIYKNKSIDSDDFPYERTNKISEISENIELQYLKIPILIQKKFSIKKSRTYFLTELGAFLNLSLSSKYNSIAEGSYSGYYQPLYEITLSENGVYDFGNFDLKNGGGLKAESTSLSYFGAIGIGHKLNRRFSTVIMGAYSKGINNLFSENYQGLSDNFNELKSITNVTTNFTLREIYLSLKLNYNF